MEGGGGGDCPPHIGSVFAFLCVKGIYSYKSLRAFAIYGDKYLLSSAPPPSFQFFFGSAAVYNSLFTSTV